MLTCVLGLTACGSEEAVSEHQQEKITMAESRVGWMIAGVQNVVTSGDSKEWVEMYNNIELGDIFEAELSYNYYTQTGAEYTFEVDGKGIRNAFASFESSLETLGAINDIGEMDSIVDDDTIIVNVPVTCENGEGTVELIFTNDIYCEMISCTLNLNESLGDLMVRATLNTLIGMGTVFIVLILISMIIACMGLIPKLQAKFSGKEEAPAKPAKQAAPVVQPAAVAEELVDDTELVAVIAAAIAAYEGTSVEGFRVRSIKRANTKKWQRA